jgi:hypothetical protein
LEASLQNLSRNLKLEVEGDRQDWAGVRARLPARHEPLLCE